MTERRERRRNPGHAVLVVNSLNGASMGRIGNLSVGGLMLISSESLVESGIYQVQFQLAGPNIGTQTIELGFQCLWSVPASTPNTFWSGCQTIDLSPDAASKLRTWVDS
ncbi:MAG: PilZ domain-containing protein [Xanthomonadales bacterium]|nr:PilZ domain-containing protein [Xanthomonadales bacterium]MCB1633454.1 PilZ domain-containing protein [Xanthomonadales bacterium]